MNSGNFEKVALTLRIPYKYRDEQGNIHNDYIKFSQLPKADILNLPNDTIHITGSRGDFRGFGRLEEVVTPTDKFEIKGKMLALTPSLGNDQSITLSAYFEIDKNDPQSENIIEFRTSPTTSTGIYEYDVEVEYNDEIDVDLNWVKLETPHARDLYRGVWDNRIATLVNNEITHHESVDNVNNVVIHRFYGDDEIVKDLWYCNRYYNILLDSLVGLETGVNTGNRPSQFLHATAFKEYWNGGNIGFGTHQSAPFIKSGDPNCYLWRNTFGLVRGYGGIGVNEIYSPDDIKKSHYETKIDIADISQFQNDYNYNNISGFQTKVQPSIDMQLIYNYVYNKSLIFSHKPWNAWIWPGSEKWYAVDHLGITNDTIAVSGSRPKTGEELNYMIKLPVFLGAKGVYYWLKTKMYDLNTIHNIKNEDRGTYASLQPDDASNFINNLPQNISQFDDPSMTLDFLDFNNNDGYYNWSQYFNSNSYRWDLININQNRVYIGLQTARYELRKLNEWLEKNGDDLLNMNLIAWYGKGHAKIKLGNFVKNYDDNIIDKFIDISQIRTRPLGLEKNGLPYYEQDMQQDSSFYDIMIHQNGTTSLDDEWTLAVVNRRTDPLLYTNDSSFTYIDEEPWDYDIYPGFRFYSTHEMETNCDNGGFIINPSTLPDWGDPGLTCADQFEPASYWREKYWQRQGVREIRIKMKYEKPGTHDKVLLRVEELLAENEPLTNMNGTPGSTPEWWRQERWNNAVKDTVIRSDGELVLKMLPGSGRMFKVTVEETQDIVGELANSNQTKIIAYPAHQTSNQDYSGHDDSVYYHMVFHRKNPQTNKYNVYYTRSQHAYLHNTNTKTIQWRPEQRLANVLHVSQDIEPQLLGDGLGIADTTCDCKYPTLTARYDTDNQIAKIYVVFNCEGWVIPDTQKVFIFERSFPIDAPNVEPTAQLDPIGYAYASSQLNGLMIDRWGLGSVNASLSGNYIAWNDSLLGIKAGFKRPEDSGYITNLISFKFNDNTNYNALFPSMNTFSMIPYYDDNAGLAWQETTNEFLPNASSKIYYTMLRIDQNYDIYNYVPLNTCDPGQPLFNDFIYSNDFKSACISPFPAMTNYKYPQVYRNAESVFNDSNQVLAWGAGDRVYWQGTQDGLPFSSIYIKMVDLNLGADCFNCLYPKKIYDAVDNLGQVNAGPGDLLITGNPDDFNWSDSSYIFNFVRYGSGLSQPEHNSYLYSITHDIWGIFQNNGVWNTYLQSNYYNVGSSLIIAGRGKYPHSVASSVIKKAGDWKLNNLIFESYNPSIKTNYSPFLKEGINQLFTYPIVKFVNKKSNKEFSLSHIELRNELSPDKNKIDIKMFKREKGKQSFLDTVQTDWIKLTELNELSFLVDGLKFETVQIKLQRKRDKRTYDLNTKSKTEKKINLNKFHLLNGKNEEYRLIILRADSTIVSNDLLISPEIDFQYIDTLSSKQLGKSTSINEQIIDLANNSSYTSTEEFELIAYPNPATDVIYASALLPLEILKENTNIELTYILANSIGTEIERTTASSGEIVNFKTHNLSSGAYFIKVESNTNTLNPLSKSKSIIISR